MVYIGVKAKVKKSEMSDEALQRLHQILYRDTRVIRDYINIIRENENILRDIDRKGELKHKIVDKKLDVLTATTATRTVVKHDLKARYPRISLNEFKECRDNAIAMYNSYLALKKNKRNNTQKPGSNGSGLIPRSIGYRRFKLDQKNMIISIMDSMDTNPKMIREGKSYTRHKVLDIPLELNNYHFTKFAEGEIKSVRIHYDVNNQLWVSLSVEKSIKNIEFEQLIKIEDKRYKSSDAKPNAVLGIDLGINIAASTALVTPKGISDQKIFKVSRDVEQSYQRLENTISTLMRIKEVRILDKLIKNFEIKINKLSIKQFNTSSLSIELSTLNSYLQNLSLSTLSQMLLLNEKLLADVNSVLGWYNAQLTALKKGDSRKKTLYDERKLLINIKQSLSLITLLETQFDKKTDGIYRKLKSLRNKRANLKLDIDRQIIAQMMTYIASLNQKYNLFVSIGKLKGIRFSAQRGNVNKLHRKRIHKWAFSRITFMLENKLSELGQETRLSIVNEAWTSKTCWKCNMRGERPKQSLFICNKCGWRGNADMNGAINIAKRAIKQRKLTKTSFGKKGLGRYLPVQKNGKVRYKPNAQKRSPRSSGTTGYGRMSKDDQSESLETSSEIQKNTRIVEKQHANIVLYSTKNKKQKRRHIVSVNEQANNKILSKN
ncbi:MAG: transposase [Candidatus Heimdallarchaeota archaeon]|nr:transposase [Candidatus Heimdallarchaeota archaeon]